MQLLRQHERNASGITFYKKLDASKKCKQPDDDDDIIMLPRNEEEMIHSYLYSSSGQNSS